ncbi:hypothetical protein JDV02_002255 [Purpureocillium takamizusanense]|uniref:VOC domain-containing protein n=1 Tax=Purpureocillium takamizusanense TaxID=2060973 RepID=A0A9Q8QB15_9HYPO|nr:uncharacterized protein JDV02_002255 [Purpureocillium takamizusanense]UNI15749.1 hypothetical protein JDV02_002255 [Purpureocillium takamizusanense]
MTDWKPPAFGTPTWLAIPATDVPRASEFYKKVFNLPFKEQPAAMSPDHIRLFDLTKNGLSITGGILKAPDSTGAFRGGKGGVCLHWFVEDVDESAKLIEAAGGKMLTEKEKEGESGVFRYFEDTEGTVGSVYMLVK